MKIAKVVLTFISNFLQARKKRKERKRIGNYRRERYYSKKAKDFIRRPFIYSSIPRTEKVLIIAYGVLDFYKYYGKRYLLQAVEVALSLWSDILQLDLVASMSPESLERKYRKLKHAACKAASSKAGDHFYLTEQRIGMPVRMFLVWYKGGVSIPNDILQEWSGIPADKLEDAYQSILQIFKDDLKSNGRWDMLTNSTKKFEAPIIEVSI